MNKTALFFGVFLVAISLVNAGTFNIEKYSSITGDWKWENSKWNYGNYQTGWYGMSAESQDTLNAFYVEYENLGTPWKYDLESHLGFDGFGTITNAFNVWTVNDPATTPATGGYTQYRYESHTFAKFSEAHLTVTGEGAINLETNIETDSEVQQDVLVDVN